MKKKNEKKVIYTGLFFNQKQVEEYARKFGDSLEKPVKKPHITFQFHPDQVHLDALKTRLGEKAVVAITTYSNDGKNEGFKIDSVLCNDRVIRNMCRATPSGIPHITVSTSEDGKPKDTYQLFTPGKETKRFGHFWLEGTVGAFMSDGSIVTKRSDVL